MDPYRLMPIKTVPSYFSRRGVVNKNQISLEISFFADNIGTRRKNPQALS